MRSVVLLCSAILLAPSTDATPQPPERIGEAQIATASARCLGPLPGSAIGLSPCSDDLELWELPATGFLGAIAADSRCLEATGGDVALVECSGEPSQLFRHVLGGQILSDDGRCLRAPNDEPLALAPCDGSASERFLVAARNRWSEIHGFPSAAVVESSNVLGDTVAVSADGVVYAAVAGGPFRSTDRGETWARLPSLSIVVEELLADPFDADCLLARQGVGEWFVSRDGARSWGRILYPGGARRQLSFDPAVPGRWLLSGEQAGMPLLESSDAGREWTEIPGPPVGLAFRKGAALHPSDPDVVAVGVFDPEDERQDQEEGVWITRNRGASWERRLAGEYEAVRFAADSHASLYAWGEEGLERSRDLGDTWTGLGASGPIEIDPGDPRRLWSRRAMSTDSGDSWELFDDQLRFTFDLAVDPSATQVIYSIGESVARSLDGAATWTRIAGGLPRLVTDLATASDGLTVWALSGEPWRSRNGGVTWDPAGPDDHPPSFTVITAHPFDPQTVYLASSFSHPALFVSRDGGDSWRRLEPGQRVDELVISRAAPERLLAYGPGSAARSLDGGESWMPIDLPFDVTDAEWDPHSAAIAYIVHRDSTHPEPGLYRSTDDGAAFSRVLDQRFLVGVATDPLAPRRLYAVDHRRLWRSDDRGASWQPPLALPPSFGVESLIASAANSDTLFLVARDGVHRSLDAGRSWAPLIELPGSSDRARRRLLGFAVSEDDTVWISSAALHFLRGRFDDGAPLLLGADRRFAIEVSWHDFKGGSGVGRAAERSRDTGTFWFLEPENIELMIKVLDAGPVNGRFWVFYGALSNVEYEITVSDRLTGARKVYRNPLGEFASAGDIDAFPAYDGAAKAAAAEPVPKELPPGSPAAIEPSETLRLQSGRFEARVSWRDFKGRDGVGTAAPISDDTGAFWFLDAANEELVFKVLDARPVNGRFWVFYGALTNVEYEITVVDTSTGKERRYSNRLGEFGSFGDIDAF